MIDQVPSSNRFLTRVVILTFALRILYVLALPERLIFPDEDAYRQVAVNLLAGHGFQLDTGQVAFRPPGYPLFLAGVWRLTGSQSYLWVRVLQSILSALAVWQVFALTARVFKSNGAALAALLVAIDPFEIFFCGRILNETLFITLLLALMYCLARAKEHWYWALAGGVCAGLGVLVKPSLWYCALFFLPFLGWRAGHWQRATLLVGLVFIGQLVTVSPWLWRNHRRLGRYTLSTMTGNSLYESLGEGATGGPATRIVKWPDLPEGIGEVETDKRLQQAAWQHARGHPWWVLRLTLRKFCRFWSPILNFRDYRRWTYDLMSVGWYVPVMVLFFLSAWRHHRRCREWLWLVAPVVYFALLHSVFVGSVRYRIPVMPLVCCVAGAAFVRSEGSTTRRPPGPARKLSVIVPFFNEAGTLPQVVRELTGLPIPVEIILVDDGSTDGSGVVAERLAQEHPGTMVMHHARNQGKGAAIRTGLNAVTGEVVVVQDADLEYDPQDLVKLWEPIAHGAMQVMYGSRTLGSRAHSYRSFYWGGQVVGWVCNQLYGSHLTDEPTCYKMMRVDVLREAGLRCHGFEFCPEITAKVLRRGLPIGEIPIAYHPRSFAEGKKIRWVDGLQAVWTLIRYRFGD